MADREPGDGDGRARVAARGGRTLYYGREGWLATIVANDERQLNGHYALYYILSMEGADRCFFVVRALVPAHKPEFPSVTPRSRPWCGASARCATCSGSSRSGCRISGVSSCRTTGPTISIPCARGRWTTAPAPCRRPAETYTFINEKTKTSTEVPLGPLHITSDEPAHFRLFVDGERIIDADYRLFYVHRGMEKLAETRMSYNEVNFLTDRICGICGFTHSFAYSSAVERALGIEVPERAQYIRSIAGEVERLHSNLLNVGLACHFIGFDFGFMQVFRVREKAMTIAEALTGARKTYALTLVGGVRRDIHKPERVRILELVAELKRDVADVLDILLSTTNLKSRTKNVGRLDPKIARDFSPVRGGRAGQRLCARHAGHPPLRRLCRRPGRHAHRAGLRRPFARPRPGRGRAELARHHRVPDRQAAGRAGPRRGFHLHPPALRHRQHRGAARRRHPLGHARRQPETPQMEVQSADLRQLAGAPLHVPRQQRRRRAVDRRRASTPAIPAAIA